MRTPLTPERTDNHMSTPEWKLDLYSRIRKLPGWTIKATRVGVTVKAPDGTTIGWHLNDGGPAEKKIILGDLRGAGFERAERIAAKTEEAQRKARIEADRKANDAALKKAAAQAEALAKAQGEYRTDELTLEWILAKHPAPAVRRGMVTPVMAEKILGTIADYQRPRVQSNVDHFATHIMNGTLRATHQGTAMDWFGRLCDGRHRFEACVQTGVPIFVQMNVGEDPDNYAAYDAGRQRMGRDVVTDTKYPIVVGTACRLVYLYRHVELTGWQRFRVNNEMIRATQRPGTSKAEEKRVAELFEMCAAKAQGAYRETRFPQGPHAAGMFLIYDSGNDSELFTEWLEPLHTLAYHNDGVDVRTDPRRALQRWIRNAKENHRRISSTEFLALFLKTWEAYVLRRPVNKSTWDARSGLPLIAVLDAKKGNGKT